MLRQCTIDGCDRVLKCRGWCNTHYQTWRRTGDPIPRERPIYGEKRRETTQGYIAVFEPDHPLAQADGYVLEHRKVAWDAKLFDDPSLQVHHKDQDRHNNDVSNLEPMSMSEHMRHHVKDIASNQYGKWKRNTNGC